MILDGVSPNKTVYPETIQDLADAVASEKGSIVPLGAGGHMHFGNPLKSADCVIDLSRMSRITAYNPAEITIHVEAGVTLNQLHAALAEHNQTLPLDPWSGPGSTIGGVAAANAQGPLRAAGSIRDWIIGMKVVHADGRVSKTGGRVVKNVTGYDLAKLYTGSLGSLAIIAEVSLKLRPAFGKTSTAVAEFENLAQARAVLAQIRRSPLQPVCCEWLGPPHALWLRFEEHPRAVAWQISQLPAADWKILEGDAEASQWETLRRRYETMGPVVVRVSARMTDAADIIETHRPSSWIAHALNGVMLMTVPGAETVARLRESFPTVIEKAPPDVRRSAGVFGVRGTERRLMEAMKRAFDPGGRLNPGRHIDGE